MASCAKCGRHPLRKNRQGVFHCRRCGPRRCLATLAAQMAAAQSIAREDTVQ